MPVGYEKIKTTHQTTPIGISLVCRICRDINHEPVDK